MKRVWFHLVGAAVLFSSLAGAQNAGTAVNRPGPEHGTIVNDTYTNEFLGFSFPIPAGWQVNRDGVGTGREVEAKRLPGGGLELLIVDRQTGKPSRDRILVVALDASGSSTTAGQFASQMVRGPINDTGGEVLREPFPVDFAGQHFSRADYKQVFNGGTQWGAFVGTKFRGYFLGWSFVAGSLEELEGFVNSLQRLSFGEDKPTAAGAVSGVTGSAPAMSQPNAGRPLRVRVSQGVAQGLLVKKVPPQYPDDARQGRIQGLVVLKALMDTNGDVKELNLVSGHPLLAPAAIEAVKQWKYKPYLLDGKPVEVETQVSVAFSLSGN